MPTELSSSVAAVLKRFETRFGHDLLHLPNLSPESALNQTQQLPRQDITVHGSGPIDHENPASEFDFYKARRWLEGEGVMLMRYPRCDERTMYLVAPIIPVPLTIAYHATTRKRWEQIEQEGLLPGDPRRGQATSAGRFDCEGYIFACEKLGTPDDAGVLGSYSAHWWRDHKARNDSDKDPDWVILRLDLCNLPNLVTNKDVCSDSGVILSGVDCIPHERIMLQWAGQSGASAIS